MSWQLVLIVGMAAMLVLLFSGAPVFLAFLIVVLCGALAIIGPASFGMFANSLFETTTSTGLATIPLFILMGEILMRSGSMDEMFDATDKLVGRIRGRQFVVINLISVLFGALAGAAMAVAAMMGRALMPSMVARGYDAKLSAGTILAGATLAPIIPPSLLAIIIGMLADVSIGQLLIAGTLPGLLLAVMFQAYISIAIYLKPGLVPPLEAEDARKVTAWERLIAVVRISPFVLLLAVLMLAILFGITTPSEAAGASVIGAIIVAALYRKLSWRMLLESLYATATVSAMIMAIMMTSKLFTQLLSFTGSTTEIVKLATSVDVGYFTMLFILMAIPFVMCMFIDSIAAMLVMIPIYKPLLVTYGFDPLWFWTLFLINISLGGMTPPFGYTMFAFKAVLPDMSMRQVYAACWPFVWIYLVGMAIIAAFPAIATWLPRVV
jgi:tripartite ATP-independent transporter DctM subunit